LHTDQINRIHAFLLRSTNNYEENPYDVILADDKGRSMKNVRKGYDKLPSDLGLGRRIEKVTLVDGALE
jgi:hypothetical protein